MKPLLAALPLLVITDARSSEVPPAPPSGTPFAEEAYWAPVLDYTRPGSLHGVANLDLTDRFVTAAGLLLENQGVMLQPALLLNTPLFADATHWYNNVSLTLGGWSSWDSHAGGEVPDHWREVDLLAGLTLTLDRNWKLSAFHTTYVSQTDSFPTSSDLALALTYDDTEWLGQAALHPFIEFKLQTDGNTNLPYADAVADEGSMLRFGIIPQRQIGRCKVELPVYFTVASDGFYLESPTVRASGYDGSAVADLGWQSASGGVGFISAALKVTLPLDWLSTTAIHTSAYAAVQYYHLVHDGLLDTNQVLGATSSRQEDILQFHLGLNLAF